MAHKPIQVRVTAAKAHHRRARSQFTVVLRYPNQVTATVTVEGGDEEAAVQAAKSAVGHDTVIVSVTRGAGK